LRREGSSPFIRIFVEVIAVKGFQSF